MNPDDLPTFMARFGTDQQCRDYLFAVRWPEGFRCLACGHGDAYALRGVYGRSQFCKGFATRWASSVRAARVYSASSAV